ncbi:MAG: AEC family transporter [Rhodocyclaceae bacterium]|nr:AEC family transporter [Rhodocyclaceae bacterium]
MLLRILAVVFPIFAIVGVGWAYGRLKKPDMSAANVLNMDLFTPLLIFSTLAIQHVPLEPFAPLAVGGVLVVLGSGLLAWPLARWLGQQPKTLAPPVMFKNSGNMGLPLVLLAFGEKAMPAAIVLFLVENFLHFSLGAWLLDHRVRLVTLWKVPVMFAGIAGLLVGYSGITIWPPIATAIRMLGDICVPLMLFSLGVRMTATRLNALHTGLLGGVASPLFGMLIAWLAAPLLGLDNMQSAQLLLFGALPPAVLNYIFAERYAQEPDKVAAIVLTGNLLSLVFVPLALAFAFN